ncbi:ATP-binding protein [Lewinella sp. IMCC34191]|uniref:ATP-binding protein n=1 Tax=Lewinella sp. IMCC34191 TaxID=2259172 RepID=UPI0018E4E326|nr:ATP-binding protein [Lewinella sp. IMCC34191]
MLLEPNPPHFTIRAVNTAYTDFTTDDPEQLIGQGLLDCFPREPDEELAAAIESLGRSLMRVIELKEEHRMPVLQHHLYVHPDLSSDCARRFWRPRNSPVLNDEGELEYILFMIDEQTEQRIAETERQRYAIVASDVMAKADFEGNFSHVSDRCEVVLGWTAEEMMAMPWSELVHPEDLPISEKVFALLLDGQEIRQFENRYRCKDGSYRWLSWNALPFPEERTVYCAAGDVTQSRRLRSIADGQKRAMELSMQGALLPSILQRLTLAMEENVTSGVRASILLLSDDGQHLLTGAAPSLPASYNDAIHGMKIGIGEGSCGTAAATGEMYVAENIATDPHWEDFRELALKHKLYACWSTPILSSTGEVFGTFALYYDQPRKPTKNEKQLVGIISRTAGIVIEREQNLNIRRKTQRQIIKARNEAQAANLAKSEFLANMSHEIRTPMNVVVGVANLLGQHESLTPDQEELVHTLKNSANGLLELIDDLLNISKIEAHGIELERVPFRMEQLLEDVADMMRPRAESKGLTFELSGRKNLEGRFIGDPSRLRQIILNLCSNAIKFTESGKVSVRVSRESGEREDQDEVTIAVSDTGIGIEQKKLKTIFQKFTQADSSINRKFGGTGLGLFISRQLAQLMDGKLSVESVPGAGSTFTLRVPLLKDAGAAVSAIPTRPGEDEVQPVKKEIRRVLVVEDFEPNAIITTRYLRIFGYPFDVAVNGTQAVERAKSGEYAVILMDVQMPELDGFEATRRIRAYERAHKVNRVTIIAMTAHGLADDRDHCLEAGMDDYLAKPFSSAELADKLRWAIGSPTK